MWKERVNRTSTSIWTQVAGPQPQPQKGQDRGLWADFCFPPGGASEEFQVTQPEKSASLIAGETTTLNCTLTSVLPMRPVRWFKGSGPGEKFIYSFIGGHFPWITSVTNTSKRNNIDFSICISNIIPVDAGTYYRMKFWRGNPDVEVRSGQGTRMFVRGKSRLLEIHITVLRQSHPQSLSPRLPLLLYFVLRLRIGDGDSEKS